MRRRRRMGVGQPDMQRHDPGFRPETDQCGEKDQGPHPFWQGLLRMTKGFKRERPGRLKQDQIGQDHKGGAHVRHDQVEEAGVADVRLLVLRDDQEVGDQRHQLPGNEEEESVVGDDHERHGEQEPVRQGCQRSHGDPAVEFLEIPHGIDGGGQSGEGDGQDKKGGERVEPDRKGEKGNGRGDRGRQRLRGNQPADPQGDADAACRTGADTAHQPLRLRLSRDTEWKHDAGCVAREEEQ